MLVMVGLAPDGVRGAPHRARQFPEDATRRFRFIRHAQELGFSLPEIGELLALRVSRTSTSRAIRTRTEAKIADIDSGKRALNP